MLLYVEGVHIAFPSLGLMLASPMYVPELNPKTVVVTWEVAVLPFLVYHHLGWRRLVLHSPLPLSQKLYPQKNALEVPGVRVTLARLTLPMLHH